MMRQRSGRKSCHVGTRSSAPQCAGLHGHARFIFIKRVMPSIRADADNKQLGDMLSFGNIAVPIARKPHNFCFRAAAYRHQAGRHHDDGRGSIGRMETVKACNIVRQSK